MFLRFTESGVVWPDGTEEAVDSVIFATGFRPRSPYLAELGALGAGGQVLHRGGISTVVRGLYFVGLSGQRTFASATLRGVGPDADRVVRHLRRHLPSEVCCG
jgi:putative flavoprotein involved in K+ transport